MTLVHLTGGTVGPVLDYTPAARVPRSHSPGLECTAPLFLELWGVSRMGNVLDGAQVARSVRHCVAQHTPCRSGAFARSCSRSRSSRGVASSRPRAAAPPRALARRRSARCAAPRRRRGPWPRRAYSGAPPSTDGFSRAFQESRLFQGILDRLWGVEGVSGAIWSGLGALLLLRPRSSPLSPPVIGVDAGMQPERR